MAEGGRGATQISRQQATQSGCNLSVPPAAPPDAPHLVADVRLAAGHAEKHVAEHLLELALRGQGGGGCRL